MSWIPFKIGQPKKQIVPKTVERDFEREYGKLQQLEEQTRRLQKDMKKSTDADLALSKSAVKISVDLLSNPLCEQDQDLLNMVTALDTAMKRMDAFNQEKVNQIQKTVIEPLKKRNQLFWYWLTSKWPRSHGLPALHSWTPSTPGLGLA
uniref:Bridging integrator 3 n=1 Tax=Saimiri boliviensis boliviensis TaxID=39432 RepID=A0A2K6SPK5_SAIBB